MRPRDRNWAAIEMLSFSLSDVSPHQKQGFIYFYCIHMSAFKHGKVKLEVELAVVTQGVTIY